MENISLKKEDNFLQDNNSGKPFLEVVAALIREGDKILICQRPKNKARGLLWEFVGGKVESGETKEQALIRECREELAITIEPQGVFMCVLHEYEDVTVRLTLFNCTISCGQPQLLEHNDLKWVTINEMRNYEFCPADEEILNKLESQL
ncbi:MAG: (deoxy)nucleoside triphosphate pyrophosphohydrolase [Candidatus Coproplasma sp.]